MSKRVALAVLSAVCVAVTGCSSTPLSPPAGASPSGGAAAAGSGSNPGDATATRPLSSEGAATTTLPAYLDPKNPLSRQRSVFFGFDDFSIKPEYRALIELHGKYLQSMPRMAIKIEGHADERGSAEYNLALGQKRAEAVRKALELYGVKDTQMEAISWGSERPRSEGHDEAAWAQNRRADLDYPPR